MKLQGYWIQFHGPHDQYLAEIAIAKARNKQWTVVEVGKGDSKAEAAQHALAKFRPAYNPIMDMLEDVLARHTPTDANNIEAPEDFLHVYCVISIEVVDD